MIFLNQIVHPSLLNIVLPLLVFFWGTLSMPRPSKTFWVSLIGYLQTIIIVKLLAEYNLFWKQNRDSVTETMNMKSLMGLQHGSSAVIYDLVLLLFMFLHRYILKYFGLWKSEIVVDTVPSGKFIAIELDQETKRKLIESDYSTCKSAGVQSSVTNTNDQMVINIEPDINLSCKQSGLEDHKAMKPIDAEYQCLETKG